ncbi:MAG TPA: PqqD family protein [Myxococcota bacterium]
MFYKHNDEHVAAEEFDGEFVLINFARGTYFSLRHAAVDVWRQFRNGADPALVARCIRDRFPDAGEDAPAELKRCIQALIDEDLLVEAEAPGAPVEDWSSQVWAAPAVEVYSDLKDLIVLDPVHEVDASTGWPRRAAGGDGF